MSLAGIDCISYRRVSTEQQAGESQTSLADQDRANDALAAKLGKVIGARYGDEGASGATVEQRPDMMRMLADCEASPRKPSRPGTVCVLNDSRFGRFPDPEESTYWRQHLKRLGWVVRFAENDDSDNLTVRSVMRAIVSSQATQKREDVRANAKRGSRGAAALGYWATRAPYGYRRRVVYPPGRERTLNAGTRKAIDEKVALVPDPTEAAIVRELFMRYATGTDTLASLVDWLVLDVPGRKWTRAAVRFTLTNPAYVGDVVSGRVSGDTTERATRPRRSITEWVTTANAHPAIVGRTLFSAVQEVLARNGKWTSRVRTDWLVSGIVRCPCGQHYVAGGSNVNKRHQATRSYRCVSKCGPVSGRCPYPGAVKKEWLESTVVDTIASVVGAPAHRRRLVAHLDTALAAVRSAPQDAQAQLAREIADGTKARDRLVQAVADGTLTGDEAKSRLDAVRRLLARLEAQRDALTADRANQHALDAERERVLALTLDFRRTAKALTGPALREFLRPWIARATFDPRDRTLTLDIRHVPTVATFAHGDLTQMACPPTQEYSLAWHNESVTRRRVVVEGSR
jgi:DNA invertase Pin-like site-specific DNA recombinase